MGGENVCGVSVVFYSEVLLWGGGLRVVVLQEEEEEEGGIKVLSGEDRRTLRPRGD